jgi:chromosome segregation ATPase
MRMASRIQSMFRAQKARSQMRADARSLRKDTQEARRAIAEARELQAEAESQTRQAQREVDATLRQLREARGELTLVRSELGHCREEISGIRVGQIQGGKRPAPALDSQSIPASPSMQMMGQAQASSVEQLAVLQVARVQEALQQAATDLASVAAAAVASPCSSISSSSRSQAASLAGPKGLTVQIPAADGDEATTAEQNVPGGSLLDALHPLGVRGS